MEAAVSAYAVNSKLWLGLGLGRQRGGFGSSKQSLSLSTGGVGCCNWSSRKRNSIINCTRRFRLESTSMGMRPRPPIERQSFNLNCISAASGSAQGYVENTESVFPYVGVACLGVGSVMLGIGYHLGSLLSSSSTTGNTSSASVAARVLLVAANIIGSTIASSLLDKLRCKGLLPTTCFSRMKNVTTSSSLLSNVKSSHDVDTFARCAAEIIFDSTNRASKKYFWLICRHDAKCVKAFTQASAPAPTDSYVQELTKKIRQEVVAEVQANLN